jgi:hypothetical protein
MRAFLILFAIGTLGLSGFAAWLFFGGPDDDPTRVRLAQYNARIEATRPGAEAGDPAAQYLLGSLYHHGEFGAQDFGEAFKWYAKAAERGHVGAEVALGTLYAEGKGTRQDYFRAAEWFRVAATLGNSADAQVALGNLYFNGRGVPNDYAEALAWFRKAAGKGHPVAQHLVGAMVMEGFAGPVDRVEAYKWLTLAMRGSAKVLAFDPNMDSGGARERLAKSMTRDQITRAEAAAGAWKSQ